MFICEILQDDTNLCVVYAIGHWSWFYFPQDSKVGICHVSILPPLPAMPLRHGPVVEVPEPGRDPAYNLHHTSTPT
jgi:hypothetical protein